MRSGHQGLLLALFVVAMAILIPSGGAQGALDTIYLTSGGYRIAFHGDERAIEINGNPGVNRCPDICQLVINF